MMLLLLTAAARVLRAVGERRQDVLGQVMRLLEDGVIAPYSGEAGSPRHCLLAGVHVHVQ